MKLGPYRFSPPWWGVALFVIVAAILCSLGAWQIQRAHYKEGLVAIEQAARAAGPTAMKSAAARDSARSDTGALTYGRHYIVSGQYDRAHQIVLNDQVNGQALGYRIWTPVILDNGVRVMVDRGWVPRRGDGHVAPPDPPAPDGPVRVLGFWRSFPQPGLNLGAGNACTQRAWPRALNYPDAAAVSCQYGAPVADGLLLLDPAADGGFVRDWDEDLVGLSPAGHYAYASQWFLMAVVAGIILVVVNTRRR
ncbi:SURF1 family protein [Salinisphaera sp. T31B1]|uniref:SURF1 family protein n=1 Tax=Salinisphaera sp. T31B1 TaxID=727963 RepID=UPI0033425190